MTTRSDHPHRPPHDALFRAVFGDPRRAADLLAMQPDLHFVVDDLAATPPEELGRRRARSTPADGDELERLTHCMLSASSLAELFGDPTG